jgi:hypothetical protein
MYRIMSVSVMHEWVTKRAVLNIQVVRRAYGFITIGTNKNSNQHAPDHFIEELAKQFEGCVPLECLNKGRLHY